MEERKLRIRRVEEREKRGITCEDMGVLDQSGLHREKEKMDMFGWKCEQSAIRRMKVWERIH